MKTQFIVELLLRFLCITQKYLTIAKSRCFAPLMFATLAKIGEDTITHVIVTVRDTKVLHIYNEKPIYIKVIYLNQLTENSFLVHSHPHK